MIAGLEAELKSMKAAHEKLTKDNKGCYNQIRAKDKELSAAEVQLEHARAVLVENKANPLSQKGAVAVYTMSRRGDKS